MGRYLRSNSKASALQALPGTAHGTDAVTRARHHAVPPATVPRPSQGGITLVEMLIALVILSLISVGTLAAIRTLGRTQEVLTATTERVDELRQVSQFLRASLRQAEGSPDAGVPTFGGMPAQPTLLRAERADLIWLAPLDSIGGLSGLTWIRLYLDVDERALKLQFMPYGAGTEELTWNSVGDPYLLVTQVDEFAIAYRPSAGEPWRETLQAADEQPLSLPQAIKLTIRARERFWPDIIVAPVQGGL